MLGRASVQPGETVLVTGASGGVGTALVQLAKLMDAVVITVTSAAHVDQVTALGADLVLTREHDGARVLAS